jgi:hypothetical protein
MKEHRAKVALATLMYRWGMSQQMIGIALSGLTFAGIFTLLLSPLLPGWGYLSIISLLLGSVAVSFLSLGFVLDRVVKFWGAQALVGTTRNPFLISRLYEKELLNMVTQQIPVLKAVRMLLKTESLDARAALLNDLDASIARLEKTARNRHWTVEPGEDVYEDSK